MIEDAAEMTVAELEARIVDTRRQHRRCEYELACLLVAFDERDGARACGHVDVGSWSEARLGLERRETRELLRIGRRLPALPRLRGAFAAGEIGWCRVREVVRVATPETDEAWTERAMAIGSRRLERDVAASKPGDEPPDYEDMELPSRVVLRFDVDAGDATVIRKALSVLRAQDADAADDGVLLAAMSRVALQHSDSPERPMPEERYRIVLEQCPTCNRTTHVGHADGVHKVDPAVAAEAACDHEVVDAKGRLSRAIPPRLRRRVMHRDRYRCAVPHCTNSTWIDVHHILFRNDGGRHTEINCAVLCTQHHRLVHQGRLRLWRDDAGQLRAEATPDQPPELGPEVATLLDMLSYTILDLGEVATCLRMKDAEARWLLAWLERRGEIVATPGGGWHRMAA